MKWRLFLAISVIANLALFGALWRGRPSDPPAPTADAPPASVDNRRAETAARVIRATPEIVPADFDWSSVESEDFREYIANLRAIGCPEETIRDIIIADVNKLYAARIAALYPSAQDFRFWESSRRSRDGDRDRDRKIRELDREKAALIKELLGVDLEREMARWTGRPDGDEYRYGFLSPEKQEQLQALRDKYRDMERAIMSDGGWTPENRAKMMALRAQREAEMAQMLTPDEYEQYQLRNSWTARNMRESLGSFAPTEAEFRDIFQLRKSFDDQFGFQREGGDEALRQQREFAQRQLDQQLQAILGPDRFREYQLSQSGRFNEIYEFTQRNNLPRTTAETIYDIRAAAETERRRLEANRTIPAAERNALLAAIAEETRNALAQSLGNTYNDFVRRNNWVERLQPAPAPSNAPQSGDQFRRSDRTRGSESDRRSR
jgi:hypothetical protein